MSGRDIGASVRQRLLNQSRAQARPFQELLQYFAMERFLYRLANSPVADRFVLKGALLLTAWQGPRSRPTMDIDLAAKTSNELDHISEIVRSVCNVRTEPDGIEFDSASIEVARIKRARNSRLKNYYDPALLSRLYPFVGRTLVEAVVATFRHRETALEMEPIGLAETYYADPARSLQWRAFVRRSRFTEQPDDLKNLVLEVRRFAIPLLTAAGTGRDLVQWRAGGVDGQPKEDGKGLSPHTGSTLESCLRR